MTIKVDLRECYFSGFVRLTWGKKRVNMSSSREATIFEKCSESFRKLLLLPLMLLFFYMKCKVHEEL